jgi:predicted amidohydrolase
MICPVAKPSHFSAKSTTNMPNELRIAAAQFENRSADKACNLQTIAELSAKAAAVGADVVAFHECSITDGHRPFR